ncbi:unnamed protein product [Urochloa humidicola]
MARYGGRHTYRRTTPSSLRRVATAPWVPVAMDGSYSFCSFGARNKKTIQSFKLYFLGL